MNLYFMNLLSKFKRPENRYTVEIEVFPNEGRNSYTYPFAYKVKVVTNEPWMDGYKVLTGQNITSSEKRAWTLGTRDATSLIETHRKTVVPPKKKTFTL